MICSIGLSILLTRVLERMIKEMIKNPIKNPIIFTPTDNLQENTIALTGKETKNKHSLMLSTLRNLCLLNRLLLLLLLLLSSHSSQHLLLIMGSHGNRSHWGISTTSRLGSSPGLRHVLGILVLSCSVWRDPHTIHHTRMHRLVGIHLIILHLRVHHSLLRRIMPLSGTRHVLLLRVLLLCHSMSVLRQPLLMMRRCSRLLTL